MKSYLFFLVIFSSIVTNAATYYVSTTGNDANVGSSSLPWRNPQKCARAPIKAGDTCIVRAGTYSSDSDLNGINVYIGGTLSPSGTASLPITIKSEKPLAATIVVPSTLNAANAAFYIYKDYYRIEGFNITGGTKNLGSSTSYAGIVFAPGADGGVARYNSIHHIGRTVCANSAYGFSGMLVWDNSNTLVEQNKFYSIGRLRNGESGCKTDKFNHDHGIYIKGTTNLIVRRNLFYDTNRGYPIHVFGGTANNINIYHNTMSGKSPTGRPSGQIMLGSTINGGNVKNNISHDAAYGMVDFYATKITKPVVVSYNLSSNSDRTTAPLPSGITFSSNLKSVANIGFVSWSARNYLLLSTSTARNRGTASGVPAVADAKPDMGAYEY